VRVPDCVPEDVHFSLYKRDKNKGQQIPAETMKRKGSWLRKLLHAILGWDGCAVVVNVTISSVTGSQRTSCVLLK